MKVDTAPRGVVVDAPFHITVPFARWLRQTRNVTGFVRSMPHAGGWCPSWLDPLSADELGELTDDGFGVTGYQIFRASRQVTAEHGRAAGDSLVEYAREIGLPDGCTLWFDAESFRDSADVLGVIDAWRKRVAYFTDTRGIYVGNGFRLPDMAATADAREQGDHLYALRGINRYWLALGQVCTPSVRGCCLDQIWEYALLDTGPDEWRLEPYRKRNPDHKGRRRLDLNGSRIDSLGGRMAWAVK